VIVERRALKIGLCVGNGETKKQKGGIREACVEEFFVWENGETKKQKGGQVLILTF
jgi:hypothetical protein